MLRGIANARPGVSHVPIMVLPDAADYRLDLPRELRPPAGR